MIHYEHAQATQPVRVMLAGADTVYFSFDVSISPDVREKLEKEKEAAQIAAKAGQVHCPEWLGARVLPTGARGGVWLPGGTAKLPWGTPGAGLPRPPGLPPQRRAA